MQKHAKKQHLYINNYNSGPNMLTLTSLTFFTAIFVAFGGALAVELMIVCWHVRTEFVHAATSSMVAARWYRILQIMICVDNKTK